MNDRTDNLTALENKIAALNADGAAAREALFAAQDEALPIIQAARDAERLADAARARTAQALAHAGKIREQLSRLRRRHHAEVARDEARRRRP